MARHRHLLVVVLMAAVSLAISGQVAPPETGKLSSGLFEAASALVERSGTSGEPLPSLQALLILDVGDIAENAETLGALGYTIEAAFGSFALVSAPADVYLHDETGIDAMPFVSNAMLPPQAITNEFRTDGAAAMGADVAHDLGFQGQGTRIAVIDGEFMPNDAKWAAEGATHYVVTPMGVPTLGVQVEEGGAAQEGPHGAACGLIAQDVAPEAEIFLLSFPQESSLIGWLYALEYAVLTLEADIVSTSMEFAQPTCHADGTGPLNEMVDAILEGSDAVFVVAAGNWASGSGSDRIFYGGIYADEDGDFRNDFTEGTSDSWDKNTLRFSGRQGDVVLISLEWDDWHRDVGTQDLDLALSIDVFEKQVAASRGQQLGTEAWPVEVISVELPFTSDYCLTIENRAARLNDVDPGALSYHINMMNFKNPFEFVEHSMSRSSVRETATNESVVAVGAVSVESAELLSYSSRGPTADGRSKPDICAPAGVTGTCYNLFHGTSASAPYAAGALAVLQSAFPEMSAAERLSLLMSTAKLSIDADGNPVRVIDLEAALEEASD